MCVCVFMLVLFVSVFVCFCVRACTNDTEIVWFLLKSAGFGRTLDIKEVCVGGCACGCV